MTVGIIVGESGVCDSPVEPVASSMNISKDIASKRQCCLSSDINMKIIS
ncbi:hypothetical protein [Pseudobacteroides cellulosolvens]|nr:hypothetical protein [Pseudobacteroides cellulosolvens]